MVLGKLSVPGRPTKLDYSRARSYCTCSKCLWVFFGHFFSHLSFLYFFSLCGRQSTIDGKTQRGIEPLRVDPYCQGRQK